MKKLVRQSIRRLIKIRGYVVGFVLIWEVVFALVVYSDIRCVFITAGMMHFQPLSIEGKVGEPTYSFFLWLSSWYRFSIPHALMLVLVISVILFTFGIFVKNVVKKLIDKKRGFTIVE